MENFKETKNKNLFEIQKFNHMKAKKEKLKEKELIKEYRKNKNREKIKVDKQNKKEKVKEKNLVNYSFV